LPLKEYRLPNSLRERLAKPIGKLFKDEEADGRAFRSELDKATFVITVGDRVTERMAELGRIPDVQVVDGRERRMARRMPAVKYKRLIRVRNPPGTITDEALDGISEALQKKADRPVRVLVEGEEDLLAIAALAAAPLGSKLYYGQPLVGVVLVKVDKAAKRRNAEILKVMGIPSSESYD